MNLIDEITRFRKTSSKIKTFTMFQVGILFFIIAFVRRTVCILGLL